MKNRALYTLTLLFTLLSAASAHAGGLALSSRGVRALSMGGAFVAGAEEANALWYNPSRIDGTSIALELGMVNLGATYTTLDGTSVSNEATPLVNPTFGAIFKLNDTISFALGAYAPYSGQYHFAEDGPQRYSLSKNDHTTQLIMNAAIALHFGRLSIGAGLQNVMSHIREQKTLSGYTGLFSTPDSPEMDTVSFIDLNDPVTFTGNFGASFDAGPVVFGASVQLPYTIAGDARFQIRMGDSVFFDPIEVVGDTAHLEVPFPLTLRGGVMWRATENIKLEAAVNFEGWSVQDKLVLDPRGRMTLRGVPGIGDYELGALVIPRNMRDTVSVHLGGDFAVLDGLHGRGGLYYETGAFPDEYTSVAQLDGDKLGLCFGASYQVSMFRFDLAVSRVFQFTKDVSNSEVRQVNATNPDQAMVIGNGRYEAGYWVGGIGAAWLYDS